MSKAKQKYYVVWQGREPGIYLTWEECKAQVHGAEGARYKSFPTMEEAEKAYAEGAPPITRTQASSLKSQASNLKSQTSNLKSQIISLPCQIRHFHRCYLRCCHHRSCRPCWCRHRFHQCSPHRSCPQRCRHPCWSHVSRLLRCGHNR